MEITFRNLAVVVVAQNHNTTILHPHFLSTEKIVPDDWKVSEGPICTPVMSTVSYDSGIRFQVEEQRLSVVEAIPTPGVENSRIPALLRSYVEKLPYVNYTAVGINFLAFLPVENGEQVYLEHFLKRGPWWSEDLIPASFELAFSYPRNYGALNITMKPTALTINDAKVPTQGLAVDINCHATVNTVEELGSMLDHAPATINDAIETVRLIVDIQQ